MLRTLFLLIQSYLFILCFSILIGLFVPSAKHLIPWNTFFLQIIFFLSSLKLDVRDMLKQVMDWRLILLTSAMMLVGLPLMVRFLVQPFLPAIAFPLFLLAAMPPGMTTPLLVEIIGGKQVLALVLTVIMSLAAPITIPLVTKFAYGATVEVDVLSMFKNLLVVIVLPFALAGIIKQIIPKFVDRIKNSTKPFSVIVLGLLIAGAIAKESPAIFHYSQNIWNIIASFFFLFVFFIFLHFFGYWIAWWKTHEERRTIAVCLVYMNFTLAIYLATKYFPRAEIVLPLVFSIIPWALLLPIWKKVSAHDK